MKVVTKSKEDVYRQLNKPQQIVSKPSSSKIWLILSVSLVIIILLAVGLFFSPLRKTVFGKAITAEAPVVQLDSCKSTGWLTNTKYVLNKHIRNPDRDQPCFTFSVASQVELDCNGYNIVSGTVNQGTGIKITDGSTDVTIRNCRLVDFFESIVVIKSNENRFIGNTFVNNLARSGRGLVLQAAGNNLIENNLFAANNYALMLQESEVGSYSNNNVITGNSFMVEDALAAAQLRNSHNNLFRNNYFSVKQSVGVSLSLSSGFNRFERNELEAIESGSLFVQEGTATGSILKDNIFCGSNVLVACDSPAVNEGGNFVGVNYCGLLETGCSDIPETARINRCQARECGAFSGKDCGSCGGSEVCSIEGQCLKPVEAQIIEQCGNRIIEGAEQCEDGNTNYGDGCDHNCRIEPGYTCTAEIPARCSAACGDGVITFGEECDDGNRVDADACTNQCRNARCGDGVRRDIEECDDGNAIGGDGCSLTCDTDPGFICTNSVGAPSECYPVCGDGIIVTGIEGCDDRGISDGDGCSSSCQVEPGYTCRSDPPGAPSYCTSLGGCTDTDSTNDPNVAGYLRINGIEGNYDRCNGNSVEQWQCVNSLADPVAPIVCRYGCVEGRCVTAPICSNSVVETGEQCDDGNTAAGDGCSAACQTETVGPRFGDLTRDGRITAADIYELSLRIAKLTSAQCDNECAVTDIDCNNRQDVTDVYALLRHVLAGTVPSVCGG